MRSARARLDVGGRHDVLDERPALALDRVGDGVDRRFGSCHGFVDSRHAPPPGSSAGSAGVYASVYTWRRCQARPGSCSTGPTRRAAILRAAAAAFAERGFADTSMDDVAAAAGITRLIVYRHFPSKEALYVAVLEGVRDRLAEESVASIERGESRCRARAADGRARRRGRRHAACCGTRAGAAVRAVRRRVPRARDRVRRRADGRRARTDARARTMGGGDAGVVRVRRAAALDRRRRSRARRRVPRACRRVAARARCRVGERDADRRSAQTSSGK